MARKNGSDGGPEQDPFGQKWGRSCVEAYLHLEGCVFQWLPKFYKGVGNHLSRGKAKAAMCSPGLCLCQTQKGFSNLLLENTASGVGWGCKEPHECSASPSLRIFKKLLKPILCSSYQYYFVILEVLWRASSLFLWLDSTFFLYFTANYPC